MLFVKKTKKQESSEYEQGKTLIPGIEIKRLMQKQSYQKSLSHKLSNEAGEALEVTASLLKSVADINMSLETLAEHINNTVNVSAEVAAFSEEVNASVEETEEVIGETLEKAKYGKHSVNEVIESIESVHITVNNMKDIIMELSEKSNKIKSIVDTIKGISKTTHLLSLNANIEAARAGEAGKGFAVVAGEVKKLAESSSRSADEIDNIIGDITKVTEDTLNVITEGMDKVLQSTKIAEGTGNAIKAMVDSVDKTRLISNQINNAIKEQAEKNQYMISVIDKMVEVSEKVRTLNENVSVNADRQKAALSTLHDTTSNLNVMTKLSSTDFLNEEKTTFSMLADKPPTFDPAMAIDINASNVVSSLNLGMVQFGTGTEVIGAIARNWHLEDDNVTWTFNLRKDMKFHNGRNITSKDVKFSFERLLSKELNSPNRWFLSILKGSEDFWNGKSKQVAGIVIEGDYNLKLVLEYPYSSFVNNLAHCSCSILPKEELHSIDTKPVGAGPYKFVSINEVQKEIIYEKFEGYSLGEALIDSIKIVYGDVKIEETFMEGKIDYMTVNAVNRDVLKEKGYKINVTECIGSRFICYNFRGNNPLVKSKEARQAINYTVDKDRMIKEAFGGYETVSKGILPRSILDNNNITGYGRNINRAKELLRKSGVISKSLTLQILNNGTGNSSFHNKLAHILSDNLREIGIELKIIEAKQGHYYDEDILSKSDLIIYGWLGDSGTADNFIEPLIDINNAANRGRFNFPEGMKLLDEAKRTKNPYKYREIISRLEKEVVEEAPMIFLSHICVSYVQNNNVKGLKLHPLNVIKLADIWRE
jgi:ABC-type transport system substrate-binding protein/methyl-accepting chemotaxis protein